MAFGQRSDPYLAFRFSIEVEGLVAGGFTEVIGLQVEIEIQEYREGGVNEFIHKRAGPAKHSANLVLKHGMTDSRSLWDWYWQVVEGSVERKNVSVLMLDETGQEQARWNFEQAYPVKWVGPTLTATGNQVSIETLELVHKGFTRAK
jgi:phage tail-like protein